MRPLLEIVIETATENSWKSLLMKSFSTLMKPSKQRLKSLKKNSKKILDVEEGHLLLSYSLEFINQSH